MVRVAVSDDGEKRYDGWSIIKTMENYYRKYPTVP